MNYVYQITYSNNYIHIPVFYLVPIEYTTFADICGIAKGGKRQMILNGHKFSEHFQLKSGDLSWRCTKHTSDGNRTNCGARVRTKVIDGYEMIKNPHVVHKH